MRYQNRRSHWMHSQQRAAGAALVTSFFFVSQALSVSALPAQSSSPAFKHGESIFTTRCIVCHNKKPGDNAPFGPPNLYHVFGAKPPLLTTVQAEQIIIHGKGQMPAWGTALTTTDIRDVINYLRTVGRQKP